MRVLLYAKIQKETKTEETIVFFVTFLPLVAFQLGGTQAPCAGPQREFFPGGSKVDTGPPNLIGPAKPHRGPCRKIIFRPGTKLAQNFFPIFCPKLGEEQKKKKKSSLKFSPIFCRKNGEEQNLIAET